MVLNGGNTQPKGEGNGKGGSTWRDTAVARATSLKRSASVPDQRRVHHSNAKVSTVVPPRKTPATTATTTTTAPPPRKSFSNRSEKTENTRKKPVNSFGSSASRSFDYQKRRGVDSPGVGKYKGSTEALGKRDHRIGGVEMMGTPAGKELTDACVYKGAVFSRARQTGTAGPGTYEWSRSDFDLLGPKRSHNIKYLRQVQGNSPRGQRSNKSRCLSPFPAKFPFLHESDAGTPSPTHSGDQYHSALRSRSAPAPLRLAPPIPETVKGLPVHSARGSAETSPAFGGPRLHFARNSGVRKQTHKKRAPGFAQLDATLPRLEPSDEGVSERAARVEVEQFLADLNLASYVQVLLEEGYDDLRSLVTLTEADCVRLGLLKGHRARLLQAVSHIPSSNHHLPMDSPGRCSTPGGVVLSVPEM